MLLLAQQGNEGFFESANASTLFFIVAVFLIVNGFFVAAEYALISVRKTKVDELVRNRTRGAAAVRRAKDRVDDFVAASQLGVTVASLLLGAAGEAMFRIPLRQLGLTTPVTLTLLSLFLMTLLHVVVGEQTPKMLAYQNPARVALLTTPVTEIFMRICRPLIWVLSKTSRLLLSPLGGGGGGHGDSQQLYSEQEIQALLGLREAAGLAEEAENVMISRVFSFFDTVATEIMVPRTEMACIPNTHTLRQLVEEAAEHQHERYPVYGKDLDDIRGVVLIKDMIDSMSRNQNLDVSVSTLMREVLCVPGSLSVFQLMSQMQKNRTRLAVVLDEFGGTAGMVTYGDILERIVGAVEESTSVPSSEDIVEIGDDRYRVSGLTLIKDFEQFFDYEIEDEHNDTIGGFVFSLLGRKPTAGDEVNEGPFSLRVESLDGLRIDQLLVMRKAPVAAESSEEQPPEPSPVRNAH